MVLCTQIGDIVGHMKLMAENHKLQLLHKLNHLKYSGALGTGRQFPCGTGCIAEEMFAYFTVLIFLFNMSFLVGGAIQNASMASGFSQNHWDCKRHRMSFTTQSLFQMCSSSFAKYMWYPAFVGIFYVSAIIQCQVLLITTDIFRVCDTTVISLET